MGRIQIQYNNPLHNTTSYIIGANRNHLIDEPNLKEKLQVYGEIKPRFGEKRKLYRLGHGPTDGRLDEPHRYMTGYHFEDYWGKTGPYPYDDIRIGLNEAKSMDCDLTVVVNYGSGTPEEAGRLVSYLNKKDDAVRRSHGDDPWNVRYFELGNEVTWRLQVGHDPYTLSPEIYAERAKEFAVQMRKNSDIPIQIGLVCSINGSWINDDWPNDESGDRMRDVETMIGIMGDDVDFLIYHGYPQLTGSDLRLMGSNQWFTDKLLKKIIPTVREAETRNRLSHPIHIVNSEYFTSEYSSDHHQGTLEALYTADTMVTCINLDIKMAVSFCFSSNVIAQSLFFLNDDPTQPTSLYQVHKLVAENMGEVVLPVTASDMPVTPMEGLDDGALFHLSYAATRCTDGSISMLVVNRVEQDVADIEIDPGIPFQKAEITTLYGGCYRNQLMKVKKLECNELKKLNFPAASVSMIRILTK